MQALARHKSVQLCAGPSLDFLRVPSSSCLEALKDNRAGQHSLPINDQFRICFGWTPGGPKDVEMVDRD